MITGVSIAKAHNNVWKVLIHYTGKAETVAYCNTFHIAWDVMQTFVDSDLQQEDVGFHA